MRVFKIPTIVKQHFGINSTFVQCEVIEDTVTVSEGGFVWRIPIEQLIEYFTKSDAGAGLYTANQELKARVNELQEIECAYFEQLKDAELVIKECVTNSQWSKNLSNYVSKYATITFDTVNNE